MSDNRFIESVGSDKAAAHALPDQPTGPIALIMKGGGLKGLAFIGALKELKQHYQFDVFAGTSAGAMVAAFLGADFSPSEMEELLCQKNFMDFIPERLSILSNLFFYGGLFRGSPLLEWLEHMLAKKLDSPSRVVFSQLPYAVFIYACRRYTNALIFDSKHHPDMSVAHAVRCSIAIPFFFTPERDQGLRVFDGGMRHNYPVDILLKDIPAKPFIGLYLGDPVYTHREDSIVSDLISISTEATDPEVLRTYRDQTVIIDPKPVTTFDFCLSLEEKVHLIAQGRAAALTFLNKRNLVDRSAVDTALTEAESAKKLAIEKRKQRKRKTTIKIASALAIILAFAIVTWLLFRREPQPPPPLAWSTKNCQSQAAEAIHWWEKDHSSKLGTAELLQCHNPIGYSILASQAFYRRAYWEAENYFTEAVNHLSQDEPTFRQTLWREDLADAKIQTGDAKKIEEAIAILRPLMENDKSDDALKWDLARAYVYRGKVDPNAYGLAIDLLNSMHDQNYSGQEPETRGRIQILKAAAYAGRSEAGLLDGDKDNAKREAIKLLCDGVRQNAAFWRSVIDRSRPYPIGSFNEENRLLSLIGGETVQCSDRP